MCVDSVYNTPREVGFTILQGSEFPATTLYAYTKKPPVRRLGLVILLFFWFAKDDDDNMLVKEFRLGLVLPSDHLP